MAAGVTRLRRIDPTCPVQLLIGRATTNLASGIRHEVYDCDNRNEAAEYAGKLEAGLLPSNINVLIFDHLVSAVEHECGMVRALGGVDLKDSLLGANQIQGCFLGGSLGCDGAVSFERRGVGWERMAPLIIGRPDQKGSTGRDNRMFVEGVLWIVRAGSPWRDLPEAFGDWNSVFRRFSR